MDQTRALKRLIFLLSPSADFNKSAQLQHVLQLMMHADSDDFLWT